MSAYLHIADLEKQNELANKVLGNMKYRLDKWAESAAKEPNAQKRAANEEKIRERMIELATVARFMKLAEGTISQAIIDSRDAYRRGYANGANTVMEQDKQLYTTRMEHGNEYARQRSIERFQRKWPEMV